MSKNEKALAEILAFLNLFNDIGPSKWLGTKDLSKISMRKQNNYMKEIISSCNGPTLHTYGSTHLSALITTIIEKKLLLGIMPQIENPDDSSLVVRDLVTSEELNQLFDSDSLLYGFVEGKSLHIKRENLDLLDETDVKNVALLEHDILLNLRQIANLQMNIDDALEKV